MSIPRISRGLAACALAVLQASRAADFSVYPSEGDVQPVSLANVESLGRGGVAYLRVALGEQRASAVLKALASRGDGLEIVAGCTGSFAAAGATDVALAVASRDLHRLDYLVAFEKGGYRDVSTVASMSPELHDGAYARPPSVRCDSWTALERINAVSASAGQAPPVKLRSKFDAACLYQPDSDLEYECFSYEAARKRFVAIGGWE